jgi:hypothetical protein
MGTKKGDQPREEYDSTAVESVDDCRDKRSLEAAEKGFGVTLRLALLRLTDPLWRKADNDSGRSRLSVRRVVTGVTLTAIGTGLVLRWHSVAVLLDRLP